MKNKINKLTIKEQTELAKSTNKIEVLEELFSLNNENIDNELAKNKDSNHIIMKKLFERKRANLFEDIASHKNTSTETLEALSEYAKKYNMRIICSCISKNKNTSTERLEHLAKDEAFLKNVLANSNCSKELLEKHYTSKDELIRAKIASNPSTPETILEKILKLKDKDILMIANNNITRKRDI